MKLNIAALGWVFAWVSMITLSGCIEPKEAPSAEAVLLQNLASVDKTQLESDLAVIDDSLARWSIQALSEPNGVRYQIVTQGSGPKPTLDSYIKINYKGKLLKNKSVFDQQNGAVFQLRGLILGWQTTLPLINKGSKVVLYIPSGLAYGTGAVPSQDGTILIPANSNLIFEMELVDFQ
jgi:FKBP-type peptidyl-prolyl cis-trans isomerase FkpA